MKFFINHKKELLVASLLAGTMMAQAYQDKPVQDTTIVSPVQRYPFYFSDKTKNKLVESIGYVKGKELQATPLSGISNSLAGRIAGLKVTQNNGEPGNYGTSFTLRERIPLVLVDGIPRDMSSVLTEHIESVTVLKDAVATAMLGSRGANGAILITTRKRSGEPGFAVDLTANYGIAQPLKLREQLKAYQYAELYNEALANDGLPLKYSQQDIETFRNGSSPYLYPDNNWNDLLLEKSAPYSRYVLNAQGSSSNLSYFLSADYMNQDGLLKQSAENTYSTNADYQRFGLRGNVAVALSPKTSLALDLYGASQKKNVPGGSPEFGFGPNTNRTTINSVSLNNLFNGMINTPANAYPIFNPNGSLGGNQAYNNNLWGQLIRNGYSETNINEGMADVVLKRDLDDVVKGWWAKASAHYTVQVIHTLVRTKASPTYEMTIGPAGDTSYRNFQLAGEQSNTRNLNVRIGNFFFDLSTGLSRNWGKHALDLSLQYQYNSATFGGQIPFKVQNGIAHATYSYDNRYVLDVVGNYSGNNWYKPGERYEVYPAAGFAWNVHNERFMNKPDVLSQLKLRASYGLTGYLSPNYYSYMYTYSNYADAYFFGSAAGSFQGVAENQIPYVRKTEKTLKLDVGLDAGFFDDRASFSVDYYRDRAYDLMQVRAKNTALLGAPYPEENLGKVLYTGVEASAGWRSRKGKFNYFINGNIAFQKNELLYVDEPVMPYPWMQTQGHNQGQVYGYIADGFVTSAGEGPVVEGYRSVPGDLKYKDLNEDGVINFYDAAAILPDRPQIIYGLNAGISVKGFDLSVLFSGVANRKVNLTGTGEWEFQNDGLNSVYPQHLGRWTAETAATATYPRLTVGNNPNNHVNSTFWVRSADFLRLKTVELGYSFNGKWLSKAGLKGIRAFLSGFNLLTISSENRFDPETFSYGYPIQRIFNAGISVKL